MTKVIEVTLTIDNRAVTLKGPEEFVREEVQRLANIVAEHTTEPFRSQSVSSESTATEQELIKTKRPNGHVETVTVLAYALTQAGHPEFSAADVGRAYRRASIRPPKVIAQALRDAKNTHDYLEQGSARGTFRLTTHGERTVVFDLPRKSEAGQATAE